MLDFYIWDMEDWFGAEETESGSSEDKQLASSVCSYRV